MGVALLNEKSSRHPSHMTGIHLIEEFGLLLLFSHDNADVFVFLLKTDVSMLTFEGQQFQGTQAIIKKITVSFVLVISCFGTISNSL